MPEATSTTRSAAQPTPSAGPRRMERACACAAHGESCARCRAGKKVQRSALDGSQAPVHAVPDAVERAVARPGRALDVPVRERMERHFGASFAHVRIHTDADAAGSASRLNAAAYAFGDSVVFNTGYYRPDTRKGQALIAHELTHILQQARGAGDAGELGPAHEREADRAADALDRPGSGFRVGESAGIGIGLLSFGELQKKAWGYVPDIAKPYVRPIAQEAKEQLDKVIPPNTEVPAPIAEVIEHPAEAANKAMEVVKRKAKEKVHETVMEHAGTIKGVVMEGTSIVDTLLWTGHETLKNYGVVDRNADAPEVSGAVAEKIDALADAGEASVFGGKQKEQGLVFTPYEIGELKGAIGSQVALAFVGVEEVQLALKAVGVLGSLRGLMQILKKQGVDGWYKNPEFVGALIGVALSFLSLKSTKAANKIINIVLASGNLISAGPAVWKLYNDWHDIPESDPEREKKLKQDFGDLVKLLANIVVDIINHKSGKHGGDEHAPAKPAAEQAGPDAARPATTEAHVAGGAETAPKPTVDAPIARESAPARTRDIPQAPAPAAADPARAATPSAATPVADTGLAGRGERPAPGTRSMTKPEWKAADRKRRVNRRVDEAMARLDADARQGKIAPAEAPAAQESPTRPSTNEPAPGPAKEPRAGAAADHPADSTRVTKQDATAVEPTANGHEAVVTKQGVGVCSPSPCPVIHVEYAKELAKSPELGAWNERVQKMRLADPQGAASEASALIRTLEAQRNNERRTGGKPKGDLDRLVDGLFDGSGAEGGTTSKTPGKTAGSTASRDRPLAQDVGLNIDEIKPVGDRSQSPSERRERALSLDNREMKEAVLNQRTKHLGTDPREVAKIGKPREPVSLEPGSGKGNEHLALFDRRFSEIAEMKVIGERSLAEMKNKGTRAPGDLKKELNRRIWDEIRTRSSREGAIVSDALERSGFGVVKAPDGKQVLRQLSQSELSARGLEYRAGMGWVRREAP